MTEGHPYTYTTLRYVHDVRTGEFLNVGVVLHAASVRQLVFKTRKTFGRVKDVFPDVDGAAFRAAMASLERALSAVAHDTANAGLLDGNGDAASLARRALPSDDSTLQWSSVGSGLSDHDLTKTLDRLYARLVARYDTHSAHRRTDEDVWRPVHQRLAQLDIPIRLEEKTIAGTTDQISFKRAWKNGVWHAYEPLSLDLADADGIKDKARRWRGHLAAVADGTSDSVKLNFIVGAPQNAALQPAYHSALDILRNANFQPKVFEDTDIDDLISEIEDEVRDHERRQIAV